MDLNYLNHAKNGTHDIATFGSYYRAILTEKAMIHDLPGEPKLLRPDETAFMREYVLNSNANLAASCQTRLNLETTYFYAIRYQITSILGLWDAVIEEKLRYDTLGLHPENRNFMEGFILCSHIIPRRVNIGFLGPFASVSGLNVCRQTIPVAMSCAKVLDISTRQSTFEAKGLSTVESGDPRGSHRRKPEPLRLSEADWEDGPEALALSPYDNTLISEVKDKEIEVISISSDSDTSSSFSDDESQPKVEAQLHKESDNTSDTDESGISDKFEAFWPSEFWHNGSHSDKNGNESWKSFLEQKPSIELDERAGNRLADLQPSIEAIGEFKPVTKKRKFGAIQ
jgi:hypothetical protein